MVQWVKLLLGHCISYVKEYLGLSPTMLLIQLIANVPRRLQMMALVLGLHSPMWETQIGVDSRLQLGSSPAGTSIWGVNQPVED